MCVVQECLHRRLVLWTLLCRSFLCRICLWTFILCRICLCRTFVLKSFFYEKHVWDECSISCLINFVIFTKTFNQLQFVFINNRNQLNVLFKDMVVNVERTVCVKWIMLIWCLFTMISMNSMNKCSEPRYFWKN